MALNPVPIGDAIATYLFQNPVVAPGTSPGLPELKQIWEHVMTLIYNDIKATMDVLPAGRSGLGLQNPTGQAVVIPITSAPGTPSNGATSAPESLIGMGSVQ